MDKIAENFGEIVTFFCRGEKNDVILHRENDEC